MTRWVDESIGTAAFGEEHEIGVQVVDVRSLLDSPGNTRDAILGLVDLGLARLRSGSRIVICCDHGISRSNTIAAAIIARRDGIDFDDALRRVQERTGEHRMNYGLASAVRRALGPDDGVHGLSGRILVTGGTGFLGSRLSALTAVGGDIVAPGSATIDLERGPFALERAVREARPSVIVHLANPRISHLSDVVPRAVAMMQSVLEVSAHHGLFLVFASGSNVLSGHRAEIDGLIADDAPCCPRGDYAMSKSLCEHMIDHASADGRIRAAILRIAPVYGPGSSRPRFIHRAAESCRAGLPVVTHVYRNGQPRVQLLHADDAVRAIMAAATRQAAGRFNIAGSSFPTTREVAEEVSRALGMPFRGHELVLDAAVSQVELDCSKAERALGWRPLVPLRSGLRALLQGGVGG
jgi:nucleoside-diphosphate-sugar epimerase